MDGILTSIGTLSGEISGGLALSGELSTGLVLDGTLTRAAQTLTPVYSGDYSFTPTSQTQTIEIENKMATADIVINPIPSNYGLITWNGTSLTVS